MAAALFLLVAPTIAYAAISMSLDKNMLDFRTMNPGETREVADQGDYHNQITCSSTNSRTWYVKAHMIRPFTSRQCRSARKDSLARKLCLLDSL